MEDRQPFALSLFILFYLFYIYVFFVCVLQFWGCSAPYSRILGVLKHLQHPPSYASDSGEGAVISGLKLTSVYILGDDLSALNVALF